MADLPNDCDVSACCAEICEDIARLGGELEESVQDSWENVQPMVHMVNGFQGEFVSTPKGYLPVLAETSGRIHNLGGGFATWSFMEVRTTSDRVVVYLPISVTDSSKVGVMLNACRIADGVDYSIAGNALTLSYPLDYQDQIEVKTYGDV